MLLRTISLANFKSAFLPPAQDQVRLFKCKADTVCNDEMYLDWLRRSCGEVANYLDLNLMGGVDEVYEHRLDGVWFNDRSSWWLKRLPVRPIVEVLDVKRYLGEFKLHELPQHWTIESNRVAGSIQIIPNPGGATVSGIRSHIMYPIAARHGYTPHEFHVRYTAGFSYPLKGTLAATSGSREVTILPDTAGETAGTTVNGFAASFLGVRNPVWLFFNGETHQVDYCAESTVTLRSTVQATYTGAAYILAYPDSIRSAVMALASIYVIEHMASKMAGVSSANLSLDALSQGRSLSLGKGFGIYSPLIERARENFQRTLNDAWDTWGPVHGTTA